jgi:hypothetical protein
MAHVFKGMLAVTQTFPHVAMGVEVFAFWKFFGLFRMPRDDRKNDVLKVLRK